jgi:hypothetical protein
MEVEILGNSYALMDKVVSMDYFNYSKGPCPAGK